jgi:hypothetical protein
MALDRYPYTDDTPQRSPYANVGFSARGAGEETRKQLENAQAFGRGVKQVATGIADATGKTVAGMRAATPAFSNPAYDYGRDTAADFMSGFNGPANPNYGNEGRSVPAPITGGLQPPTAAPALTQRPDDITGSAARIQAANPRGGQAVPQMARNLVQESQQRFAPQQGVEGSIGVDGYMRQLQNIRALNQMDTPAGPGILGGDGPTWQERQNAEMTSKWAQEDRDRQFRGVLGGSGADARARMGAYTSYANAQNSADVQRQNALLGFQGGRERDASAERIASSRDQAAFGLETMRGRNQLAAEGMHGGNQLAAERMRGENQFGLEGMRRAGRMDELTLQGDNQLAVQDARQQAEAPWRNSQAGWYDAQKRRLDDEIDQGASQVGRLQKLTAMYGKDFGLSPDEARRMALKDILGADRAARMANGGVVGFADGGGVAPMSRAQQMLADMDAKYGKTTSNAPAAVPQPTTAPTPVPQQQPQGVADKFRGYFGATDARMKQNGLAFGGAVSSQDIPGGQAVAQAVAGRQVFGQSDGSGEDDALPAVIDGKRPAALTSGEFVWPVKAVQFYGMDRLNKMLAAAEKGMAPQGDTA